MIFKWDSLSLTLSPPICFSERKKKCITFQPVWMCFQMKIFLFAFCDCFYTMSYNIYLTVLNGLKRNSMARQTFDHHLTPIEGRIFLWIELLLLGLLSQVMPLYTSENATSRLLTKGGLLARIPNMASHIPQWTTALNSLHFSCS